jgi:PAS domain S-box-containing protein
LADVLGAIPEPMTVHSGDSVIRYANRAAHRLWGNELCDLIGMRCGDIFHRDSAECPHEAVLASGQSAQVDWDVGREGPSYRITIDPIIAAGGSVRGYVRVARDVSDRVRTQEALLRAERFATLGQMISGIAHDVGTPLSIISGYAEYLLMRTVSGGPGHKELSTILNQTRRIAEFIKQLLDLARPEQGRVDAIGLKGFLDELLELMGHHLKKTGVKARLICTGKPPVIYGDSPRLRQALFNLVLNASQRVGSGGHLDLILDEAGTIEGSVMLAIVGTECGGMWHDFSQSFAEFLETGSSDGALGVGLSLTREILRGIGAKVRAIDSGEGKTYLAVELPVSR